MNGSTLVSTAELSRQLSSWRVFDCRHDLAKPRLGEQQYLEGHIPGALFASLDRDLSAPKNGTNGRHPLPDPKAFVDWMGRQGLKTLEALRRPVAQDRGQDRDHQQQHERRDRHGQQRALVALKDVDRREHDRAEDHQREDVQERLRDQRSEHNREVLTGPAGAPGDDHRARRLPQPGGQGRGHQHSDECPLQRVAHPDTRFGERGGQDRVP